jgi:hypothetical protein
VAGRILILNRSLPRLEADYNETVGTDKFKFEQYICTQIEEQLGESDDLLYEIGNLTVWPINGKGLKIYTRRDASIITCRENYNLKTTFKQAA